MAGKNFDTTGDSPANYGDNTPGRPSPSEDADYKMIKPGFFRRVLNFFTGKSNAPEYEQKNPMLEAKSNHTQLSIGDLVNDAVIDTFNKNTAFRVEDLHLEEFVDRFNEARRSGTFQGLAPDTPSDTKDIVEPRDEKTLHLSDDDEVRLSEFDPSVELRNSNAIDSYSFSVQEENIDTYQPGSRDAQNILEALPPTYGESQAANEINEQIKQSQERIVTLESMISALHVEIGNIGIRQGKNPDKTRAAIQKESVVNRELEVLKKQLVPLAKQHEIELDKIKNLRQKLPPTRSAAKEGRPVTQLNDPNLTLTPRRAKKYL